MRTIVIIFVLLLSSIFVSSMTNNVNDIDIVIRTLIPSVLGYFLTKETSENPAKIKIVQFVAISTLVMLLILRWSNARISGNIFTIRDVLMHTIGHLLGKSVDIKKPPD